MKRIPITARHLGRAGLACIAVAAALAAFAVALVVRLYFGPISLGPFSGDLRASLDSTLPGLAVRFDDAALEWSREEGRLNLVILGARVIDDQQRIVAQAPEAEVGLALGPFIHGKAVVRRITLVGVQLTLVHGKDGILRLGVRGESGQSDILQKIRDAIARSDQGASSLESFAVNRARLAFFEEETGVFVVAPRADLQVTRGAGQTGKAAGAVKATVDANIEIAGKPARVEAELRLPASGSDIAGDASVTGLSLRALAANSKFFAFLAPFDLKADLSGSFALANGTQLRSADFGIGASGTVNDMGRPLHVRAFRITGRYDGRTGRLLIDDATLEGIQARAHMDGTGDLTFDPQGVLSKIALDLQLDKLAIDMPGVMGRQVTVAHAAVRGTYLPSTGVIAIDQGFVFGSQLSAKFAGRLVLAQDASPEIDLDGDVAAIDVRDLLHYWPLQANPGTREWIDGNVPAGRIGPVLVHTHIPAGALDQVALPDRSVEVTFPIRDATIIYIRGVTPMTGIAGSATLSGDTFRADIATGAVGPLTVSNGHVVIPNLHLQGTQGNVTAHVEGSVPQVLALIDQKPLKYPSRFHIRTATAKGTASVDLSVRVPMLRKLKVDDVGISVRAATTDLALQLSDRLTVTNSNVNFVVDNNSLRAVGTVNLDSANLAVDWSEAFKPKGPISTRIKVAGELSGTAREQMGIHLGDYVTGPVGVSGELDGNRGNIQRAQLKLDLTPSTLAVKMLGYRKPAGIAAQAQVALRLDPSATVRTADIGLAGTALAAHGTARWSPAGDLQALDVPSFRSGTNDDFTLSLTRDPAQGSVIALSGRSFDAEALLKTEAKPQASQPAAKAEAAPEPYRVSARLDRVALGDGVVMAPFVLNASGTGWKIRTFSLNTSLGKSALVTGSISNASDGPHLMLSSADAGALAKGVIGSTSLKGGLLDLDALITPPAKGEGPDLAGKLTITDFTIANQPFLTRLFSAGSFGGLADLMRGKGIAIDKLEVPFTMRGGVITVREARATGPSLGLTGEGYYDMGTDQLALQGAFAPLYGINSVWGAIPVLGDVLVSKKGEGIFGVNYSASGSADNPDVRVNPLSALTPGILRRLFQGKAPTAPPAQATTNPPAGTNKPQ